MQLSLLVDNLMHASHRHRVERFYGVYKPVEGRLPNGCDPIKPWIAVKQRHKTPHLDANLTALGHQAIDRLPLCTNVQSLISAAECFGCLYVLEGATLGGQIILGHAASRFGYGAQDGAAFFHGYGSETGAMWRTFGHSLTAFAANSATDDEIVAAAVSTFRALRLWCERKEAA